ncbi:H-NS histone family protein (plasmid) [Dyella sp. BiH032]|uniref:H-NS histone family protein n=1 Tax=Dyella sp. BiH032 TaxID=3075430 RepID=UPI0028935988|nr:H-NS histone family protein [Dyella sp. BiH032]WNL48538.1 H-NS histone family protein [Dyella sp. BiH032]
MRVFDYIAFANPLTGRDFMGKVDLSKLSYTEVLDVIGDAEKRAQELREQARAAVREEINALLAKHGFTLDEVMAGARSSGRRSHPSKGTSVAQKYRNPANPKETWTGRGKQPAWYRDALDRGVTEDDMLIQ